MLESITFPGCNSETAPNYTIQLDYRWMTAFIVLFALLMVTNMMLFCKRSSNKAHYKPVKIMDYDSEAQELK